MVREVVPNRRCAGPIQSEELLIVVLWQHQPFAKRSEGGVDQDVFEAVPAFTHIKRVDVSEPRVARLCVDQERDVAVRLGRDGYSAWESHRTTNLLRG